MLAQNDIFGMISSKIKKSQKNKKEICQNINNLPLGGEITGTFFSPVCLHTYTFQVFHGSTTPFYHLQEKAPKEFPHTEEEMTQLHLDLVSEWLGSQVHQGGTWKT